MSGLEVLAAGPGATVQDEGRRGLAHLGVGRSGAADASSAALANRLVGNPPGAALLELTLGGLCVRSAADVLVAVTGAPAPVHVGARPAALYAALRLPAGLPLRIGLPTTGLRTYVAVRGGVAVPPVLGSRSTDALGGLGPAALRPGDLLPVGPPGAAPSPDDGLAAAAWTGPAPLRAVPGPRADVFGAEGLALLASASWVVGPDSDRVGARLQGPRLLPRPGRTGDAPSEGVVPGSVQVPGSSGPVLLLADAPVTGGYPVIATVVQDDVRLAAQARPGEALRFRLLPAVGGL